MCVHNYFNSVINKLYTVFCIPEKCCTYSEAAYIEQKFFYFYVMEIGQSI